MATRIFSTKFFSFTSTCSFCTALLIWLFSSFFCLLSTFFCFVSYLSNAQFDGSFDFCLRLFSDDFLLFKLLFSSFITDEAWNCCVSINFIAATYLVRTSESNGLSVRMKFLFEWSSSKVDVVVDRELRAFGWDSKRFFSFIRSSCSKQKLFQILSSSFLFSRKLLARS